MWSRPHARRRPIAIRIPGRHELEQPFQPRGLRLGLGRRHGLVSAGRLLARRNRRLRVASGRLRWCFCRLGICASGAISRRTVAISSSTSVSSDSARWRGAEVSGSTDSRSAAGGGSAAASTGSAAGPSATATAFWSWSAYSGVGGADLSAGKSVFVGATAATFNRRVFSVSSAPFDGFSGVWVSAGNCGGILRS